MTKRAAAWLGALGLCVLSAVPASARQVALVMRDPGAGSVQGGSNDAAMQQLVDLLWGYGVEVIDTSRAKRLGEATAAIPEFERKLTGADVGVLYYVGVATTGRDRSYVLSPGSGASGAGGAPPAVQSLLESMRSRSQRSVAVFDILKRRIGATGTGQEDQPGLGGLTPASGNQLVAYMNTFEDRVGPGGLVLTSSLLRHLRPNGEQPLQLVRLASLVKEDVAFETGGLYVPWVIGSISNPIELKPVTSQQAAQLRRTALLELLRDRQCVGADDDQLLRSAVNAHRQTNRQPAVGDLTQLANADVNDMLWILRSIRGGDCPFTVVPRTTPTVTAPPATQQRQQQATRPAQPPQQARPQPVQPRQAQSGSSGGGGRGNGGGGGGGGGGRTSVAPNLF